ncbi:hypothetical protein, partial [Tenacibaculum discolor]|uniref:hypothetical protein n=1 Tax=Tenacibaculum discolor TaxID=361581 RepID=UPI001F209886
IQPSFAVSVRTEATELVSILARVQGVVFKRPFSCGVVVENGYVFCLLYPSTFQTFVIQL